MIITVYRYDSEFANVEDAASLIAPLNSEQRARCTEYHVELPDGYTVERTQSGEEAIFNACGEYVTVCALKNGIALYDGGYVPLKMAKEYTPATVEQLRKKLGLRQIDLADLTGISLRQIQRAENEPDYVKNMSARNFVALCDALGADPHDLIK